MVTHKKEERSWKKEERMILFPDWLQTLLDESGLEKGKYVFDPDGVDIVGLPDEFMGIAESEDGGLAVARETNDGVIYRFEDGNIEVMATDETTFIVEMKREEVWQSLEENMPAGQSFGIGLVLFTKSASGERLVLGTRGMLKPSALVISGEVHEGEMLVDAVKRELDAVFQLTDFEIVDVLDEGSVVEVGDGLDPVFRVEIEVEKFDVREKIKDLLVDWVSLDKHTQVN